MSRTRQFFRIRPLVVDFKRAYKTDKKVLVYIALTFVVLVIVVIYSFDTFGDGGECKLVDATQTNLFERKFYDSIMRLRFKEARAQYVSLITITDGVEPLSVITNTCESREFLTSLVHELVGLRVKVIAIDQSFSNGACPDSYNDPKHPELNVNGEFTKALEESSVPIVVGWGTHMRVPVTDGEDCLMLNDRFHFSKSQKTTDDWTDGNVSFGLIRLNDNLLKIPLHWSVFPYKRGRPTRDDVARSEPSFSLITAQKRAELDPKIKLKDKTLEHDIDSDEHPYSSFVRDESLLRWSAMDVLCNGKGKIARGHPEWGDCDRIDHKDLSDLEGQTIVVGSMIASEHKNFLDKQIYGAELHANYIEALLNHRYVRSVNPWIDKSVVVLFVVVMLFLQFLTVRKLPDYEGLRDDTALWFTCVLFLCFAAICFGLLEWRGWFFPVFFLSCFPISMSLITLTLYQAQAILTRGHLKKREGAVK